MNLHSAMIADGEDMLVELFRSATTADTTGVPFMPADFAEAIAKMRTAKARGQYTVFLGLLRTFHVLAFVNTDEQDDDRHPLTASASAYRRGHRAGDNFDPSAARAFRSALERLPATVPWDAETRTLGVRTLTSSLEPGDMSTGQIAADIAACADDYRRRSLRHARRKRKTTRGWA